MISYEILWDTMKKRGISQYALINKYGVSPAQITRLKKNEGVSTRTIDNFCRILDCEVPDVMIYKPDKEEDEAKDTSAQRKAPIKRASGCVFSKKSSSK